MLSQFVTENQSEIIERARIMVARRWASRPVSEERVAGIPMFLEQLAGALLESGGVAPTTDTPRHAADMLRMGFTIGEVVHEYGDVCQSITELALEYEAPISTTEFRTLNRCLDDAIAVAVTEYARLRDGSRDDDETRRLSILAHELGHKLNVALLAYALVKDTHATVTGNPGAVLERSLHGIQALLARALGDSGRHISSATTQCQRLNVRSLVEEIAAEAGISAAALGLQFDATEAPPDVEIEADRQLLLAAVMNVLVNAFKFSHPHGQVWLRTSVTAERVVFDVEDQCGGLPATPDELFELWAQRHPDNRGVGLGLPLVRRNIQAMGGDVIVTNRPGHGCTFSIRVPRLAVAE
jgi:signal transduction histidine kinase